jgi:hypothetical protein
MNNERYIRASVRGARVRIIHGMVRRKPANDNRRPRAPRRLKRRLLLR